LRPTRSRSRAQKRQLTTQFIENRHESPRRRAIRRLHLLALAECFHDQINRTIVQMQPAIVW
jgi:hypothetical protein